MKSTWCSSGTTQFDLKRCHRKSQWQLGFCHWIFVLDGGGSRPHPCDILHWVSHHSIPQETPGVPPMAETNATERKRPSRAIIPAHEKLPVGRKEAAEMLSTSRRTVDDLLANEQLITRPNLQDEVSFLRLPELKSVTGLSKSSLYALIRANSFPSPVQLGPRTVAWVRSEVRQWAAERISKSRSASPDTGDRRTPQRALGESWATSKKYA
jgi:prophage regulatory protein